MISISKDDIKNYKEKGWVQVSLGLSSHSIQKYFNSVQKLEDKAKSIQYPMGRTYYPFISDKNKAALETPFNKLIINEGVKSLFEEIKHWKCGMQSYGLGKYLLSSGKIIYNE